MFRSGSSPPFPCRRTEAFVDLLSDARTVENALVPYLK
jgi:hypothetical protein